FHQVGDEPCSSCQRVTQTLLKIIPQARVHEDTEHAEQNREASRVPEDHAKLQRAAIHKSSSVARQYPAPRTVWISFWGCASSTFVRKCRTYTSTMFVRP